MIDLLRIIRDAVGPAAQVGRISVGLVPLPPHVRQLGLGNMGLIVNCELPSELHGEAPQRLLELARHEAVVILRSLAAISIEDTSSVAIRFGYYDGEKLRETVYACNLPVTFLTEASARSDFSFWNRSFGVSYPTEYSTLREIDDLLKSE